MKKITFWSLILLLPFTIFAVSGSGKPLQTTVYLDSIKLVKTQESNGDELYFTVTEFPNGPTRPSFKLIPDYPTYWPSAHISEVKNVALWQKKLAPGEGYTVVFDFMEQDTPPFDLDDLFGEVKMKVANQSGKIVGNFSLTDHHNGKVTNYEIQSDKVYSFEMSEEGSYNYIVNLKLHAE